LIAVAGARSGLGKTVFATNLVVAMQAYEADVALIDLSMNPGDFFTCLDYVPRHTLVDAVKARDQLDATYLSNLLAQHPLGFKFLACPNQDMDPNDFYGFSHEDAIQFIQLCRSTAQFVILDTGVHDLPFSVASVEEADLVFMVTTRDLARLLSLQRMLKGLKDRGLLMEKIKVIVNNAEVGVELSDAEVETVLEHPVTAYLPSIPAQTTFSINSGNPLAQSKPELPFCAVIQRLAEISLHRWLDEEDQG
jgi:pilus assembly protein CpaE